MTERDLAIALAAIIVLGVGAQWLATRMRAPSILLLLVAGFLAGPVTGLVEPEEMFGDLLLPAVSLGVGFILFEGGLSLRYRQLRELAGRVPVLRLVTVGVLITWVLGSLAAWVLLGVDRGTAAVLGAILVVSGPTVIVPILRHVRPREPSAAILRWEAIVIDPIGALLAIVVLDAVIADQGAAEAIRRVATTIGVGTAAGALGALFLVQLLRRHWVPDHLHNPVTLGVVVAAFAGANLLRPEAGLFAATVLGVGLANQSSVSVRHITAFGESLGLLIVASLFVVLGAAVDADRVAEFALPSLGIIAVLVLVARPAAVWASTVGSDLLRGDRRFLAAMAPRGIVAAAVASIFALELAERGRPAEELVPVTFTVILGTVVIYGLGAAPAARRFRVERGPAQTVALVDPRPWALQLAEALISSHVEVMLITTDEDEIAAAAERSIRTFNVRVDSEEFDEAMDSAGISKAIALSGSDELNTLWAARLAEAIGRANVFHLPVGSEAESEDRAYEDTEGRRAFAPDADQQQIEATLASGGKFVVVGATEHDTDLLADALPLFEVSDAGDPVVLTSGGPPRGRPGHWLVVLSPA